MSLQDDSSSSVPPSVEDRVETRTWTEISSFAQEISLPVMLPEHHHDEHQLMWVTSGSALVTTRLGAWLVAPGSGLWMPAGVAHTMSMSPPGSFRTLYLVPTLTPPGPRWECAHSLTVGPTLGAIIHRLDGTALDDERRARSAAVLVDLLDESSLGESTLPVPDDPRAEIVARSILGNPADARDLHEWADEIGVSTRTLARAFREETSLTFSAWRARARLGAALGHLQDGASVDETASAVGYATASAFIVAFRALMGTSPGAYARSHRPRRAT
ncbi:AraC family transcriptional regulator [Pseudoclavibacter chungangensis]|uniref:HTH-type transcriptional regulator RipA n=1 Tax=Pseudoclavibacter chungangensis TaxID=587635 RepID=A0A7J5BN63_9MICO|nr:AraC family transcriptional regulator [Pseudoclavibacter chungangensis]KAB1653422.1 AraC family transcriptional regulator [Pseudoclavibacter chungangensis]KAB1657214.1 AraC family transcriptional regulator [Pseudoclavibacter chungangensis]NYJ66356.1 AraC-like DNA-binding protein/mannose-6-phosphate isomerase-like protein (cupin superfamily) [Pseudoclavibacter chungangensis]